MKMTPAGALMHQVQTRPKSAAFVFHEEVWTYERLAVEAESLARGLALRGVGPGDRVAIHMVNRPEMIVAYYACFQLGAIAAPLRTAFKFAELAPILRQLRPALYLGEMNLYGNVAPVDGSILAPDKRFVVNGTFEDHGVQPWETLFDVPSNENLSVSPGSYKPAILAETTDLLVRNWGLSDDDIMLEPLPLAHMSGLITSLAFIQFGTPFVLLESFDADIVLDTIEHHRCTWCIGFPAQFAAMLGSQLARPRNLKSLRICLTGADVCPIELQQRVTSPLGAPL